MQGNDSRPLFFESNRNDCGPLPIWIWYKLRVFSNDWLKTRHGDPDLRLECGS
jgi:hypothetical protein